MKRCFLLTLLCLCALTGPLRAADDVLAAVKRADAARVQATISGDATRLRELLTDDLSYGHNDGRIQTKAEFINAVASKQVRYEAVDYVETNFKETAPGVVTMTGRVRLKVGRGDVRVEFALRFLAVWREEAGQWRLHAYQSTRLPDAPAATPSPAKSP
ncbi:MAG TPA: nuclear transport factor 2 family protein [Opitutaceae bacterium]|nr:nuclear transport factor 2 family protein [Opitutaceae bacterium]